MRLVSGYSGAGVATVCNGVEQGAVDEMRCGQGVNPGLVKNSG